MSKRYEPCPERRFRLPHKWYRPLIDKSGTGWRDQPTPYEAPYERCRACRVIRRG